jgi:prophage tail gpP-like protein
VITGYVDRVVPSLDAGSHGIALLGRSKSQDIVDCSAEWPSGQINGSSLKQIAEKLLKPYGISVEGDVDTGPPIPKMMLTIGESAFVIIERIARYRGIYDLPNGNIRLARAGSDKMGSGVKQGVNLQRGRAEFSMDGRFSDYEAFNTAVDLYGDVGKGPNLLGHTTDAGVKRRRLRTIINEAGAMGMDVAVLRAKWDAARRAGRSTALTVTVDSWRDTAGKLWAPNASIPIEAPALKLPPSTDWIISQVAYRRNSRDGTCADLVIMPKEAFLPEPVLLQPLSADVARAF